jgi:hypothetical protein
MATLPDRVAYSMFTAPARDASPVWISHAAVPYLCDGCGYFGGG